MSEWTDERIIEGMSAQPGFLDSLVAQIGSIRRTRIDRLAGEVHFYGEGKNCTFKLPQILQDLKRITETNNGISFR